MANCSNLDLRWLRGSTEKFYEWLKTAGSNVPTGPSVWICGDCHLGNLGPLADAYGNVNVQIRDLDQTVIGNPAHDLIRPGRSLPRCWSLAKRGRFSGDGFTRFVEGGMALLSGGLNFGRRYTS
jgi:uncharacterized protein (DUF2252 family)